MLNISYIFKKHSVLGAKVESNQNSEFWSNFLLENPNYLPGLIEIGDVDKVKKIDPNFSGLR